MEDKKHYFITVEDKKYYFITYEITYPTFPSGAKNVVLDIHPLIWKTAIQNKHKCTVVILWFTEIPEEIALQELS